MKVSRNQTILLFCFLCILSFIFKVDFQNAIILLPIVKNKDRRIEQYTKNIIKPIVNLQMTKFVEEIFNFNWQTNFE